MQATSGPRAERFGASRAAIASHYDLSDDFIRLVLGPEMVYSCALFRDGDDLATAQMRKLDHHITEAGARGAARVLDVGCGWGALLDRLVTKAGVGRAVGLTLSRSQSAWIRQNPPPGVEVREENWRDHKPDQKYGAIISIGAFEHFVRRDLDPAQKVREYREFFKFCDRVLISQGRLSLQTIAYTATMSDSERRSHERLFSLFARVFPESDLPLPWEPIAAADGMFELIKLSNVREDYFRTLRAWDRNLTAHHDAAVALVGDLAVADFHQYLRTSAAIFRVGTACLLRMTFVKLK